MSEPEEEQLSECWKCGASTDGNPCEHCGAPTRCAACAERLEGKFCVSCGTPAPEVLHTEPTPSAPPSTPPWSSTSAGGGDAFSHIPGSKDDLRKAVSATLLADDDWRDPVPLYPPTDGLGGSLYWAIRAIRANWGSLLGVTVLAILISGAGLLVSGMVGLMATATNVAFMTFTGSLVQLIVLFSTFTWSFTTMVRAWSMIVHGSSIAVGRSLGIKNFGASLAAMCFASPLLWLVPIGPVIAIALMVYVAGDGLSVGAAISRVIGDATSSFLRMAHIAIIGLVMFAVSLLPIFLMFMVVAQSVAAGLSTTASNIWSGTTSRVSQADAEITVLLGALSGWIIGVAGIFFIFNIGGLWTAAFFRRLSGSPVGAIKQSDSSVSRLDTVP
ncbi:MAG: hypothetical protein V9F03_02800 [Microthrixaceae bacterium]